MQAKCMPLDAFGPIDHKLKIPITLVEIIDKLLLKLNHAGWIDDIVGAMEGFASKQTQEVIVVDENLTINEMISALAFFFRMDQACYKQDSLEIRLRKEKLDKWSKIYYSSSKLCH